MPRLRRLEEPVADVDALLEASASSFLSPTCAASPQASPNNIGMYMNGRQGGRVVVQGVS